MAEPQLASADDIGWAVLNLGELMHAEGDPSFHEVTEGRLFAVFLIAIILLGRLATTNYEDLDERALLQWISAHLQARTFDCSSSPDGDGPPGGQNP